MPIANSEALHMISIDLTIPVKIWLVLK